MKLEKVYQKRKIKKRRQDLLKRKNQNKIMQMKKQKTQFRMNNQEDFQFQIVLKFKENHPS